MALHDTTVDTGGEFGIAGLLWQHGVQFPSSDGPLPTAGLRILAAQRNSPPVSLLGLGRQAGRSLRDQRGELAANHLSVTVTFSG